jgi:hypothetical protein
MLGMMARAKNLRAKKKCGQAALFSLPKNALQQTRFYLVFALQVRNIRVFLLGVW